MENKTSWDISENEFIPTPSSALDFFEDFNNLCKRYNLSISHEDGHGAFILEKYNIDNIEWLEAAHLDL